MNEKEFSYYTPGGLYLCGNTKTGDIVIKKSSYRKLCVLTNKLFPDKNADTIILSFVDYWQSHLLKVKESKFKSPTTIWKYKKIWKKIGLIL